jgi:hypothetical protein
MPPVTRRGYNNEFKHEVKSVSMPLQGHRISSIQLSASAPLREPRHFMAHFPRGRDDLRVVRLNAVAGAPHFIHLSRSAPPRLCASQGTLWRISHRGRDDLSPVRLNALTLISSVSARLRVEPSS